MTSHDELRERAKELRCLYTVSEILSDRTTVPTDVFRRVVECIPEGWQHPERTGARLEYLHRSYVGPGYQADGAHLSEPIRVWGTEVGRLEVSHAVAGSDEPAFLAEERELQRAIAARLGEYLEWKHTELLGGRMPRTAEHWRWRENYAIALAAALDGERFGVSRVFLTGSTESGDAGPGSDIDLVFVFSGTEEQRAQLLLWLEGWSLCLAEIAFQQTGVRIRDGALGIRMVAPHDESAIVQDAGMRELPLARAG
ncbi:nucleotidyltransferase domain-containing protein [Haliangium ochraceum]|uniref:DNA polymerase beta domain protein region n=1 Tax=Haliangium ochraceum (strain DSM 14365 / JCM 11303 / SMP-2) TaxID=502025 RepID=D0LU20_HALO1|nr:nucleotidyltransferase domain-containing protein [Haliangium ochraceum]ACY17384.1 DNA polymerase beta domain protein region [Haliangium ochraceum DSM 14365]